MREPQCAYDLSIRCTSEAMDLFWRKVKPILKTRWVHRKVDPRFKESLRWLQCYDATRDKAANLDFDLVTNMLADSALEHMRYNMGIAFLADAIRIEPHCMSYIPQVVWSEIQSIYDNATKHQRKGYIYFLYAKEPQLVKIGYTSKLQSSRVASVHSHCPYDLELLGMVEVPNGISSERKLHKQFELYRHNREWFNYTPDLADSVSKIIEDGHYDNPLHMLKYGTADFLHDLSIHLFGSRFKLYNDVFMTHTVNQPKYAYKEWGDFTYEQIQRLDRIYAAAEDPVHHFHDILKGHAPVVAWRFIESLIKT